MSFATAAPASIPPPAEALELPEPPVAPQEEQLAAVEGYVPWMDVDLVQESDLVENGFGHFVQKAASDDESMKPERADWEFAMSDDSGSDESEASYASGDFY